MKQESKSHHVQRAIRRVLINTFPQVYDTLGRFLFLGLTADF